MSQAALSHEQFRDQIKDRYARLGITYHHIPDLMNPGPEHEARLKTWTRSEPAGRTTIGPRDQLHTDQGSLDWNQPDSETIGPVHVVEDASNDRWLMDGHHRLAQARGKGQAVDALVWRAE
jgi:hypothetical protein